MGERPITDDDVASATRGLQLDKRTDEHLMTTLSAHRDGELSHLFASRVIVAAVRQEIGRRTAREYERQEVAAGRGYWTEGNVFVPTAGGEG